jgi:hypothetical protein
VSKFKVSFNLDLTQIAPEMLMGPTPVGTDVVEDVVTRMFINEARRAAKDELHRIRRDQAMDADVKVIKMSEQIRKMMITLMAQANMSVEAIGDDVEISTELPFEKAYDEDVRRAA